MGAIVAIMGEAGDPELPIRLERMLARSPYRGDPVRHHEDGLAIAVQTRGWDASLATVGNWTVAIHGVIGNFSELAPAHGWTFPDDATSATKLAIAYEDLGDALFGKLRGEYAILIHDRRERRLIAVRDLWGRRPLFFERTPTRTYIASEIRQIRAGSGTPNEIDGDVLIQAILWRPTYPTRTHVQGVGRVQADRVNAFDRGHRRDPDLGPGIWQPPPASPTHRYDFDALTEELRYLIDRAVDRWLIGIPFAVSLSGGVDSSTIWCSIADKARAGDPRAAMGRAFTCRWPDPSIDESPQVERILAALGTTNHSFVDPWFDNAVVNLARNTARMDSPSYGAISAYRTIRQEPDFGDTELVLGGFGGDLVLGGSRSFLADLARDLQPRLLLDLWTLETPRGQGRIGFIWSRTAAPVGRRLTRLARRPKTTAAPSWIHPSRRTAFAEESSDHPPGGRFAHQRELLGTIRMQQGLAAQEGSEQMGASHGVEAGAPLVDRDVVDFAHRLPPRAFSDGRRYKQLLRAVRYDRLGEDIRRWRCPLSAFSLTEGEVAALRHAMPPASWTLASSRVVDPEAIEALFTRPPGDRDAAATLGDLAVVEAVIRGLG
jgi:asparagine synthase (glutamine-hydrolysing)